MRSCNNADGHEVHSDGERGEGRRGRRWPGVASTPGSPTDPVDYVLLEGIYVSGLAGLILLTRRRERSGVEAIPRRELPVLAMATFALADVVAKEKISTWLREPFVREDAAHKPVVAEGDGLRRAVGELLTCTRCVGTWSALGLVALRTASAPAGHAVATVLALTGANDLLQGGFRLLAERADLAAAAARHEAAQLDGAEG